MLGPPKNPKNGKKWQKGLKVQKIYPLVVPNQEFAPLEVKNEKTGTVGKSRSLSGQVLCCEQLFLYEGNVVGT